MEKSPHNDAVLIAAIRQLHLYDAAALEAKETFLQARRFVLIFVTLGTITALLTSYVGDFQELSIAFALATTILPALATTLIADIQIHGQAATWLTFRLITERIRGQIWLYRMGAGSYGEEEITKRDNVLNEQINRNSLTVGTDKNISLLAWQRGNTAGVGWYGWLKRRLQTLLRRQNTDVQADDATWLIKYTERFQLDKDIPAIEHYIEDRGKYQMSWYEKTTRKRTIKLRSLSRWAGAVLFLGAIFPPAVGITGASIELIALASLTNILSFSITTWMDVATFGQTVGLFHVAHNELQYLLGKWNAMQDDPEYDDEQVRLELQKELITEIEDILAWEREKWFEVLLQSASTLDDTFFNALDELQKSEKFRQAAFTPLPSQRDETNISNTS